MNDNPAFSLLSGKVDTNVNVSFDVESAVYLSAALFAAILFAGLILVIASKKIK